MSEDNAYYVQISTPLDSEPTFLRTENGDSSIDNIISDAIDKLKQTNKSLKAEQLENLYQSHQLFNGGNAVKKGDLLKNLKVEQKTIENKQINFIAIDLVAQHSGGN